MRKNVLRFLAAALLVAGLLYALIGMVMTKASRDAMGTFEQLLSSSALSQAQVLRYDSIIPSGSYVLYGNERVADVRARGIVMIPGVSDQPVSVFFARWRESSPQPSLLADTGVVGLATEPQNPASPITITLQESVPTLRARIPYGYLAFGPKGKFVKVYAE
jgi:hypothetical protein